MTRLRKAVKREEYDWTASPRKKGRSSKRAPQPPQPPQPLSDRASTYPASLPAPLLLFPPSMASAPSLPALYAEVPEVMRLGEFAQVDPLSQCSEAEILNAFQAATEGTNVAEDFSFESILGLGSLPHEAQEVAYQIPSPNTLSALPTFTTVDLAQAIGIPMEPPSSPPPKPRFSTVKHLPPSPDKVAFSVALKSSLVEFRPWRSNTGHNDSFMDIPVSQKDVFGRINAMLAAKPKKQEIRKSKLPAKPARQTTLPTLPSFKQRKPSARQPPTPRLGPVPATVVVPALKMPAQTQEVVFNRMLVCTA